AVAVTLFAAKLVRDFKKNGSRRTPIVCAHVSRVAQRIIRVVMPCDHDDTVSGPGKFRDDIANRELPLGCIGRESVVLHMVALQLCVNVVFELLVIGAANGMWA